MNRKILVTIFSIIAAIILTSYLWHLPYLLIPMIIAMAIVKHVTAPTKNELSLFIVFSILGPTMESLIMLSGAWSYAAPQIFNFPIWLPFLWGLAGTIAGSIYEILKQRNS